VSISVADIKNWTKYHTFAVLTGWLGSMYCGSFVPMLACATVSLLMLCTRDVSSVMTLASGITTLRFSLIMISLMNAASWSSYVLFAVLVIAILLDVVDGYVARKMNQTTLLGQHYDMEVDAIFVLSMGVYYYAYRDIAMWILVPGLLRYLYTTLMIFLPKETFAETKQRYASTIAGIFFVILLAAILLQGIAQEVLLFIGSLLIAISFGKSFFDYLNYNESSN